MRFFVSLHETVWGGQKLTAWKGLMAFAKANDITLQETRR